MAMRCNLFAAVLGVIAALALTRGADEPKKENAETKPSEVRQAALERQERLQKQFEKWTEVLLRVLKRAAAGGKPEARAKAAVLKEMLERVDEEGMANKFTKLVDSLKDGDTLSTLDSCESVLAGTDELAKSLRGVAEIDLAGLRMKELEAQRSAIENRIKKLKSLVADQNRIRAAIKKGDGDLSDLARDQQEITKSLRTLLGRTDPSPGAKGESNAASTGTHFPGDKRMQEALPHLERAEAALGKAKTEAAVADQGEALEKLEQTCKDLAGFRTKLDEEYEGRVQGEFRGRCDMLLREQTDVESGTVLILRAIAENPDKKPTRSEAQKAAALADRQNRILTQTERLIAWVQEAHPAGASPEYFRRIREDMIYVSRQLKKAEVGDSTQKLERRIIDRITKTLSDLKSSAWEAPDPEDIAHLTPAEQHWVDANDEIRNSVEDEWDKLHKVNLVLSEPDGPRQYDAAKAQVEKIDRTLKKNQTRAAEAVMDLARSLGKLKQNRIPVDIQSRLESAKEESPRAFEAARKALADFREALATEEDDAKEKTKKVRAAGGEAEKELTRLAEFIRRAQDESTDATELNWLGAELQRILNAELKERNALKALLKKRELDLLKDLKDPDRCG
jgi:hypothetical protein